ncbi:MAG: hypothetical protein HY819_22135 [Acidobacteria bacterium]|nr:hypothetical protein [Acidobacteriota bacterium]
MFFSSKSKFSKVTTVFSIMIMLMMNIGTNFAQQPTPQLPPVLDPKGAFQEPLKSFLSNIFRLSSNSYKDSFISLAVNSAQGLQYSQVKFLSGLSDGSISLCLGLPGQSPTGTPNPGGAQTPFPPTSTAQIPRVVLDPQGVLSYAANSSPLTSDQKNAVDLLYSVDQVSRGNYAANVLNLARVLTTLKNTASSDDVATNAVIDEAVKFLEKVYNSLADFNANAPDPDVVYGVTAAVLRQISSSNAISKVTLNTALNILAIGYSNYLFNRLPINGTNNPTPTTRGPLPPFTPNTPLSAAQANPGSVFGAGVLSYLSSIGVSLFSSSRITYQVNSADKLQAAIVALDNQTMTIFFTGANFPPTSANPPQIVFSTIPTTFPFVRTGASQYAKIANNDPAVAQRVQNFFANNPSPRAAYLANLNNLLFGFNVLDSNPNLPSKVRFAIKDAKDRLQKAINGLNQSPVIIPDVLALYKQVSLDLDDVISGLLASTVRIDFTDGQVTALVTLATSTLPIGLINYYARPVILSQV